MFDLKKSVLNWKYVLKNSESFTTENIEELESHLNEQITDLKETGLSDEEAFWVAQKRIGSLKILVPEYEKVNNLVIFRKRIFWMVNGILCMIIFAFFSSSVSSLFGYMSYILDINLMKATYAEYIVNEIVFALVSGSVIWIMTLKQNNRLIELKSRFINSAFVSGKGTKLLYGSLIAVLIFFFVTYYFRTNLNIQIIKSESYKEYKEFIHIVPMALLIYHSLVLVIIYHISFKANKSIEIAAN